MRSGARQPSAPREILGGQLAEHPRLDEVVLRHRSNRWLQPVRGHNQQAFETIRPELLSRQFVIDAGCGTGQSTLWLARRHPDKLILGIDRSEHRLSRKKLDVPSNVRFIRADLEDWWRLTSEANLKAYKQTIFYPNPYPKASQLQRRWHAHPVFPALVSCGGELEVRTNWEIYIREGGRALRSYTLADSVIRTPSEMPVTAFEKKYLESGQHLFQLLTELG